jgi:hypothetical protein
MVGTSALVFPSAAIFRVTCCIFFMERMVCMGGYAASQV